MAIREVQRITCNNSGGFVMQFWVYYTDDNGNQRHTNSTHQFPVGQSATIDLDGKGVPEGSIIYPSVKAIAGKSNDNGRRVKYSRNGQTASYRCHGTTFDVKVDLQ